MTKNWFTVLTLALLLALAVAILPFQPATVLAVSNGVVISQVYGGGGNAGATYTHDFVELFNRGTAPVSLDGWSVQYASATGTGNFGNNAIALLSGTLSPGQYYLVQLATNGAIGSPLPAPDATGTVNMSGSSGKVALVNVATGLACNGGSTPCSPAQMAQIVDLVGYGTANFFEGSPAPTLSVTTAAVRASNGCSDTDNNGTDFSAATPAPRNTAAPLHSCTVEPKINEFSASTAGTDVEYVEIFGIPGADYSAYTIIEIEGDTTGSGIVDEVISAGIADANGFWLQNLPANALENGTLSLLLVKNFTGALNVDLDTNNDGVLDATPWDAIIDGVSVNDGGAGDFTYGVPSLGPNYDGLSPFAPGGASRYPDGFDSEAATDWVRNDFDLAGIPGFPGTPVFGEAFNSPGALNQLVPQELAPSVDNLSPGDGATFVPLTQNITISFSEPVNLSGSWFGMNCTISGMHDPSNSTVSGGPTTFTIDPANDLVYGDTCTLTVFAAYVADQDSIDPPDNLAADYSATFTTLDACGLPYTHTYSIQGSGANAAITGAVTTQGVVVGDYEGASPTLRGFYLQDLTGDGDPATSDGIFIFNGSNDNVNLGDVVRVTGNAAEFQNQTQISSSSVSPCGTGSVAPVDVTFPIPDPTYLEQFEGMLVRLPQTLYVTEHFQLGRFGQVVLSSGNRLQQPTNVVLPGAPALAMQAANDLNRIIIDDALNSQNPDPILFGRGGQPLSASNTLRGGDTATNILGVMTYTWAGNSASGNAYRVRPINALGGGVPNFQPANPRPAASPAVGGTLKVVGMNVLNYFNTFDGIPDVVDNCTLGVGGAATDCRGADTQAEFDRQWPKTVAAILAMNPDVIGVVEIENDGYGPESAIQHLVDQLNAGTAPGTYAFIDVDAATGQVNALGTDAIKVGLVYKPATVTPVGNTAALNTVAFVNGGDSAPRTRPSLAQAFVENASGSRFIIDVNHFKSKGSACDAPDGGDGQGNCNAVRVQAATELLAWLGADPTATGDPDVIILGDLNSYAKEDPITVLQNGGFTNLIESFTGADAYSYVFDGQWGYLDHALGSASLSAQVVGVAEYHTNADEPSVLDYNTNFKSAGQIVSLYAPDQFRNSDHDPVVVGLNLNDAPVTGGGWIQSPAGAYTANPNLTGKANFVFDAKYNPSSTVPVGDTSFQFRAANLYFTSVSYEYLVTTGNTAIFKGAGTINGQGSFQFMITAIDDSVDTFRIEIWYMDADGKHVIYDNGSNQPIGGGNITIHR